MRTCKLFFIALLVAGTASCFFWGRKSSSFQPGKVPIIAITQIIEHHTLDTVRAGFMAELAAQGFDEKTTKIVYENAHGNVATATQIGSKFAALRPQLMVALSTQSAQLLSSLSSNTNIPLVFTAVTDPVAAKLVPTKAEPGAWITGVSDFMEPEPQLDMMRAFLPTLTRLGVLYNPSEINSVSFLKAMEEVARAKGIELVYAALSNTSEASGATASLAGKVDALYFPNDNTAMTAVGAIASTALKHHIPVFANDSASVERGALAAVAYDRFAMGRKTGEIAIAILKGKKPQDIPVVYDTPSEVVVNERTLNALKLTLPATLKAVRKI
ncbi:MAG: transporter permease [Alphaproteobacteria bacterium]|jgi:putative ABC transport system substrate-binding protein|nr:transporter permease [Alphaproteobacteria bacterium]